MTDMKVPTDDYSTCKGNSLFFLLRRLFRGLLFCVGWLPLTMISLCTNIKRKQNPKGLSPFNILYTKIGAVPFYLIFLTFILCLVFLIYSLPKAQSSGSFFNQTDWSQGTDDGTYATQNGWKKYHSADVGIDTSEINGLKLTLKTGIFMDTTGEDFQKGTIDETLIASEGDISLGYSLRVNEYTVGAMPDISAMASEIRGSGPWTVIFSNSLDLSRIFKNDKFIDDAANSYKIISVSDALNQIIVVDSEMNAVAPVTGRGTVGRWYSSLAAWEDGRDGNGDADLTASGRNAIERALCYYDGSVDTSNLIIDGWTTDAMHYIEIYVPFSERHNGKWSENAYTLMTSSGNPNILVKEDYTKINGLQIENKSTGTHYALGLTGEWVEISGNIIRGVNNPGNTNWNFGIVIINQGKAKIWNNIVYHFRSGNMRGRGITGGKSNGTVYAYNNTVYGCDVGIDQGLDGIWIVRNNISYKNNRNYQGVFDPASNHNLSGPFQKNAPGGSPQNAAKVNFADEESQDFHLTFFDTTAKDGGINLSSDKNLAFSTDIDLDSPRDGLWDIGADEASSSFIMTHSIGTGARHFPSLQAWEDARDGNLITRHIFRISNQSDVFIDGETVTSLSGTSGIYIKERDIPNDHETHMTLDDVKGIFSTGDVLKGTTSGAVATLSKIFTRSGAVEKGEVYRDSSFTAGIIIDGSLTDSGRYMILTAAPNSRHTGVAGTGAKIDMQKAKTSAIAIGDDHTVVEWLEVTNWSGANAGIAVYGGAKDVIIQHNIIHDNDTLSTGYRDDPAGIELNNNSGHMEASNNIIYNILNAGAKKGAGIFVSTSTATRIFNNIIYNAKGTGINSNYSRAVVVKNNIAVGNGKDFSGKYSADSDENISSDMSAPGPNSLTKKSVSSLAFISTVRGAEDLHTMAGSIAGDINLNLPMDILGDADRGELFSFAEEYNREGIFISQIYDTNSHPFYLAMMWTAAMPDYTSLELKVRTSDEPEMSYATDWTLCPAVLNNGDMDISSLPCVVDGARYIQYRAEFASDDGKATPKLEDVTITYEGYPLGRPELVSSPFNTKVKDNIIERLSWKETIHKGVDGIKIQLRSAPDKRGALSVWGDWLGPKGADDYYQDVRKGVRVNPEHQDGIDDQWVQYKVQMFTTGLSTPKFSDINIVFSDSLTRGKIPSKTQPEPTVEPVDESLAQTTLTSAEKAALNNLIETSPDAGTQLYDVVIKLGDNYHSDPKEDARASFKEGDVVVIRPAGHNWSDNERRSFLIIQLYLTEKEVNDLKSPKQVSTGQFEPSGQEIKKTIKRRARKIDLSKLGLNDAKKEQKKLHDVRNILRNKPLKKNEVVRIK